MDFKAVLTGAISLALLGAFAISTPVAAGPGNQAKIDSLQPDYTLGEGVYSAYYGPDNGYVAVSPGSTATYMGRQSGLIKAGLTIDPTDNIYEDEGLFGFIPAVTIDEFSARPLTYDVVNQFGINPVWMTIEIDTGVVDDRTDNVVFQMVPAAYAPSNKYVKVNARTATNWLQWTDTSSGITTGSPRTLASIATQYPGVTVVRTYLRLGMGDSYGPGPDGTQAWVDKAEIGGVNYDFVVRPAPHHGHP